LAFTGSAGALAKLRRGVNGANVAVGDDLLVAENVRCAVGGRWLFDGLSLTLVPGGLVEVRGANGSGKSTLLRCLVGLHEPDSGTVRRNVDGLYVGHRSGICGRMTPVENLRWTVGVARAGTPTRSIEAALVRVGLGDVGDDLCDALSAGQQRRVALARLLVCPAPVWILDEPLTALDDAGRGFMCELMDQHRSSGGAAVCATHENLPAGPGQPAAAVVRLGR